MIVHSASGRIFCDRCKSRHRTLIAFEAGPDTEWWLCNSCFERIDRAMSPLSDPGPDDRQADGSPGYAYRKP